MSPWATGQQAVEELLAEGLVIRLVGADAGRRDLMARAHQLLTSAGVLVDSDPATAYLVAYDAAKHAAMALLAEQNLRVSGKNGHLVMQKVLLAQFHGVFNDFDRLRRRRNDLDYPTTAEDFADNNEAHRAIETATKLVDNAEQIFERGVLTTV
ncbi:MAG: HEPN domain-containing protein [Ornithinimicrobium sp.]